MSEAPSPSAAGIRALTDLCRRAGVEELEAGSADWMVRLRIDLQGSGAPVAAEPMTLPAPPSGSSPQLSQWVGVFHRAAEADTESLVQEGQSVREGEVVAVIVAMQLQHEVRAERDGVLVRFLVEDGAPVEYGQPLLELS